MTDVKKVPQNVAFKEVIMNNAIDALSPSALFGRSGDATNGLEYSIYGGCYYDNSGNSIDITDTTIQCNVDSDNYIQYNLATKTVENLTEFVVGNIAIAIVKTDNEKIIQEIDKRAQMLVPHGFSPISGGGDGGNKDFDSFAELKIVERNIANAQFTLKGGLYWGFGAYVQQTSEEVISNYFLTNNLASLESHSVYYVVFDFSSKNFRTFKNVNATSYTSLNSKLLYVVKTNATDIYEIIDYRNQNILFRNKTQIFVNELYSNTRQVDFNVPYLNAQYSDNSQTTTVANLFPSLAKVEVLLMAKNAVLGYNAGEEVNYITGSDGVYGKPFSIKQTSNQVIVLFDDEIKVMNKTTQKFTTITNTDFVVVLKVLSGLN